MYFLFILLFALNVVHADDCQLEEYDSECAAYCYTSVGPFLSYIPSMQKRLDDCETANLSNVLNRLHNMENLLTHHMELTKSLQRMGQHDMTRIIRDYRQYTATSLSKFEDLGNQLIKEIDNLRVPQPKHYGEKYFKKIGTKYYYIENGGKLTWLGALQRCANLGSHLVHFESEEEWNNVRKELLNEFRYWLDLNDVENEGKIVSATTGQPPKFAKWNPGEPNELHAREDCVELVLPGYLNDCACSDYNSFICETDELKIDRNHLQKIDDKYYYIENFEQLSWINSLQKCSNLGGHLASLQNQKEWHSIKKELQTGKNYWIDITDIRLTKYFESATTNNKANFVQWSAGNPDKDKVSTKCVELRSDNSFEMNDRRCVDKNHFICEFDTEF